MISDFAWLIPALPAAATVLIMFFGKRMPGKGAEIGITAVAAAFLLSLAVAFEVFTANVAAVAAVEHGSHDAHSFLHEVSAPLTPIGSSFVIEVGMRIDGLAAMMFLLVTFVSLMVQIYSTGYMHGDPRYTYFFCLLSLFTFSMLLLVIANNLFMVLMGWELVGVCSYLLIGFWWEEKENSNAAIKAFLTTKFGDIGLIVGVAALWSMFQTFNIGEIIASVEAGVQAGEAPLDTGLLTFALVGLFLGCVGKSAQFPLHTWLPDAMAGPTPVSALIHAATMVTAGVFLIARLYPVFHASPVAVTVIAVIGAITLLIAGLLALVQDDVKRVLAYSTVSQLGYMVAALAFSYTAGIFHLFTHGFFKALLFLGSGSLIHAVHSNNMSDMGGLRKAMPVTFWTFLIGSIALAAIPPFAGFWSKDEVLAGALGAGTPSGTLVLGLGALGGMITAFYMTRTLYLVFAGEFRGPGEARASGSHPHESPPSMKWPLVALAVPAALIGFVNLPFEFAHPRGFAAWTMFDLEFFEGHPAEFVLWLAGLSTLLALVGFAAGRQLYRRSPSLAEDAMLRMGLFTRVLENRYYLDHLYTDLIVRGAFRDRLAPLAVWFNDRVLDRLVYLAGVGTNRLGRVTYDYADQKGIDGAVNGIGVTANWSGGLIKFAQSGNVQFYAGALFVGVFVFALLFAVA
jgi:NADH-quinone oxidoreductase subunit L